MKFDELSLPLFGSDWELTQKNIFTFCHFFADVFVENNHAWITQQRTSAFCCRKSKTLTPAEVDGIVSTNI